MTIFRPYLVGETNFTPTDSAQSLKETRHLATGAQRAFCWVRTETPGLVPGLRTILVPDQQILCDADVGSGLAFRKILPLQLACSDLAQLSDQSASSSSVPSTSRHVLACNSKTLNGVNILTLKMEIITFHLSIGTIVPQMSIVHEEYVENEAGERAT